MTPSHAGHQQINSRDLVSLRLFSQQFTSARLSSAEELLAWMGAMQAQDYPMAKWAIGIRLAGSTDRQIDAALDRGAILRTHLLRPTWHFVSADDIYWLLELTSPQIMASAKFREKWLGLTKSVVARSNHVIECALSPDRNLTRDEIIDELNKAKIRTDEYRSGHLLMRAELEGLICSGKAKDGKTTYALLEKRVPRKKMLSREDGLRALAYRYFSSRGPATLPDFKWWSGLSMTDARNALEMAACDLASEVMGGDAYWFNQKARASKKADCLFLLPAFDEFLIAYKNRTAALDHLTGKHLVSENGVFRPSIIVNGKVTGLWKRTKDNDRLVIQTRLFRKHTAGEKAEIQKGAEIYGNFLGLPKVECRV